MGSTLLTKGKTLPRVYQMFWFLLFPNLKLIWRAHSYSLIWTENGCESLNTASSPFPCLLPTNFISLHTHPELRSLPQNAPSHLSLHCPLCSTWAASSLVAFNSYSLGSIHQKIAQPPACFTKLQTEKNWNRSAGKLLKCASIHESTKELQNMHISFWAGRG